MKVLVTCGPTMVAIDDVRVLTNTSTGTMGRLIAEGFKKAGAKVKVIQGPMFFDAFAAALKTELVKKYDIVVHAAAVSDFKPAYGQRIKISSARPFNLRLVPTQKLINQIKSLAPETFLVGFKLESTLATAIKDARALFVDAGCDLVVANSQSSGYQGVIVDADGKVLAKASDKKTLANALIKILK